MKTFALCGGIGGLAFILAGMQAGIFNNGPAPLPAEVVAQKKVEAKPVKARFPQDLAPAARAEPVPMAAAYKANAESYKVAILKSTGALFEDWQEKVKEEWQAESVEETSLVLVLGPQKKIFVELVPYPNGAPPISRYKFEVEASVVEAKTGKVLANRVFVNNPRNIQRTETWETTALGSPVEFRTIFYWMTSGARAGFPATDSSKPIVNVVN